MSRMDYLVTLRKSTATYSHLQNDYDKLIFFGRNEQ